MSQKPQINNSATAGVKINLTVWDKISSFFKSKDYGLFLTFFGVALYLLELTSNTKYGISFYSFIILLPIYIATHNARVTLPLFVPMSSKLKVDFENRKPIHDGNPSGLSSPEGIIYMGNDMKDNKEVYLSDSVARQHLKYLGTTGSGKTVGQSTLCISYYIFSSGYSLTDGKADLLLPTNHMSLAYRFNRIDDCLVINYIQGDEDIWNSDPYAAAESNAYSPYSTSSSKTLIEMTRALLDGDGDIWAKRADSYVPAMIMPNVYKRDKQEMHLTINRLADMLILENAGALLGDESIPDYPKSQLRKFIETLPGMNQKHLETIMKGQSLQGREGMTILDQFGYVTMQIIPILNMLAGEYGFIFNQPESPVGHIDMEDVVINRRILMVLLPALETSQSTLSSLGRITLQAQKSMMAKSLGSGLAGATKKNLADRNTSSPTPFLSDNDEVGYYIVEGTAVTAAQARSIGFSLLYGAQDLSAMRRLSDMVSKEVDSLWGNTNVKMFGRVLDNNTIDEIKKSIGEHYVARADRFSIDDSISGSYREETVSLQKENIVDERLLKNMIEGECIVTYMDKNFIMRIPMMKTEMVTNIELNDFLTISDHPSFQVDNDEESYKTFIKKAGQYVKGKEFAGDEGITQMRINSYKNYFEYIDGEKANKNAELTLVQQGVSVFAAMLVDMQLSFAYMHDEDFGEEDHNMEVSNVEQQHSQIAQDYEVSSKPKFNISEQDLEAMFSTEASTNPNTNNNKQIKEEDIDFDLPTVDVKEKTEAEQFAEMTSDIFEDIFSGTDVSEQTIKTKMSEISQKINPNISKTQADKVAEDTVSEIKAAGSHPTPPSLKPDPASTKHYLTSLVSKLEDELRNIE